MSKAPSVALLRNRRLPAARKSWHGIELSSTFCAQVMTLRSCTSATDFDIILIIKIKAQGTPLIDEEGFRLNVGIIVMNDQGKLLWARRIGTQNAWQFPQGGIQENESPIDAMYRELTEELGLTLEDVEVVAESQRWLGYRLPKAFRRYHSKPLCIGQKQKWFLLRLRTGESNIDLKKATTPEFDEWCWVEYWYPLRHVIQFKRAVYRAILQEFKHYAQ